MANISTTTERDWRGALSYDRTLDSQRIREQLSGMVLVLGRTHALGLVCFGVVVLLGAAGTCRAQDSSVSWPAIFAVRDDQKLCLVRGDLDTVLYEFGDVLESPSLSPDGRFLAAFVAQSGVPQLLGLVPGAEPFKGGIKTELVLLDRYARDRHDYGEVRFRRSFQNPQNIIYAEFLPPVWLEDCQRFYLPSRDGVNLAHVDGTIDSILQSRKVTAMARVPGATRCIVSNDKAVFVIDTLAHLTTPLVDTIRAKKELAGTIRALACSHDGRFVAVGHGRKVSVLEIGAGRIAEWGKLPHDVYWLGWLPHDTGLVILCGSEDRETAFRNSVIPTGISEGGFEFRIITNKDSKPRRLYDQVSYDVRRVGPAITSDGRYVAFASRKGMARGVLMVLPVDGGNEIRLTEHYLYRSPIWGPD